MTSVCVCPCVCVCVCVLRGKLPTSLNSEKSSSFSFMKSNEPRRSKDDELNTSRDTEGSQSELWCMLNHLRGRAADSGRKRRRRRTEEETLRTWKRNTQSVRPPGGGGGFVSWGLNWGLLNSLPEIKEPLLSDVSPASHPHLPEERLLYASALRCCYRENHVLMFEPIPTASKGPECIAAGGADDSIAI